MAVEASYRVRLPQPLCNQVDWITGDKPIAAWLLMANSSRCRLFSVTEAGTDSDLQSLGVRIAEELSAHYTGALEFQDPDSLTLTLRLVQVQVKRHETSGWRLTLPRPTAAIMHLIPGKSSIAAMLVQGHIELLTIELLRSAANAPLSDIF